MSNDIREFEKIGKGKEKFQDGDNEFENVIFSLKS